MLLLHLLWQYFKFYKLTRKLRYVAEGLDDDENWILSRLYSQVFYDATYEQCPKDASFVMPPRSMALATMAFHEHLQASPRDYRFSRQFNPIWKAEEWQAIVNYIPDTSLGRYFNHSFNTTEQHGTLLLKFFTREMAASHVTCNSTAGVTSTAGLGMVYLVSISPFNYDALSIETLRI